MGSISPSPLPPSLSTNPPHPTPLIASPSSQLIHLPSLTFPLFPDSENRLKNEIKTHILSQNHKSIKIMERTVDIQVLWSRLLERNEGMGVLKTFKFFDTYIKKDKIYLRFDTDSQARYVYVWKKKSEILKDNDSYHFNLLSKQISVDKNYLKSDNPFSNKALFNRLWKFISYKNLKIDLSEIKFINPNMFTKLLVSSLHWKSIEFYDW